MENPKHVHFIGIGGVGMSGLARHYLHEGWVVSGSDSTKTANTEKLETEGALISYKQSADNIPRTSDVLGIDLVVYTEGVTAATEGWAELMAAHSAGIETINYFEALGRVANQYYLIAIAGSHGKTTTTAMVADILEEASFDPSVVVGSLRSKTGSNYRAGKSKYFVVEACEYKRDFLHLKPDVLIITNIDHEHVDYYKDLAAVQAAFAEFANSVPDDGVVIANATDPHVAPALALVRAQVIDYRPDISLTLRLKQPGLHNRQNAAAALAAARFLGIEDSIAINALENFAGTWRRFEYKGMVHNAPVYDDYAHNPQKVAAAIAGTRELYPDKKLTVVFQPHTYTRTKVLFAEFVEALAGADRVLLLPIYAAREPEDTTISSEMIVHALVQKGISATHYHTIDAAVLAIQQSVDGDDVVLCVGAGSVTKAADLLTAGKI